MPFLPTSTSSSPLYRQTRERLEARTALQARREFWFAIKFVGCVLGAVTIISFLVAVYGLR